MSDDHSADDESENWRRVRDADDASEPAGYGHSNVKTDPDEVRGWAEERDAVPVTDPDASGPEAYALRHENVVDGSAHERVSWEDFAAAFRGEEMAFHHADEDEAGTHRFVHHSDVDEHISAEGVESEPDTVIEDDADGDADRGVTGTAEDEGRPGPDAGDDHADEVAPDIGAADTETGANADRTDADAGDGTVGGEGTVVGDREGGIESGANADAGAGRADAGTETAATDTGTRTTTDADADADPDASAAADADLLSDVSEGDSVVDDQGESVGIVTAVEGTTLYVDPDPGLTEKLSAKLGWVDEDDAEYTVDADDVVGVEDGDVRLESVSH